MNFASLRIGKIDQGTETAAHNHNLRASSSKQEKNVNRTLTCNNELLLGRSDTVKAINEKIESLNLKTAVRKDANRAIEFVLSASPEHFYDFEKAGITRSEWDKITIENLGEQKYWERLSEIKKFSKTKNIEQWKKDIVSWVNSDSDLKDNLISLVVHDDEKTLHAHLIVTPVVNGKLTAKQFFTPARATAWQDSYAAKTNLARGISSDAKHQTKVDYDVQQVMKKAYKEGKKFGYEKGKKFGYEKGKQEALEEESKLVKKFGLVFDAVKSVWHQPSSSALAEAEALKKQAKKEIEKAKTEATKIVQDEQRRRTRLEQELEKKSNIATNLEAENKRLKTQLEGYRSTASNKQSNKFKR